MNAIRPFVSRRSFFLTAAAAGTALLLVFATRMVVSSHPVTDGTGQDNPRVSGHTPNALNTATSHTTDLDLEAIRNQQTKDDERFAIFAVRYQPRLSFPDKYDGRPAADAPLRDKDRIIAIHKRYWRNYAQIDQARFTFASHTYRNEQSAPTEWDMDAEVDMQYGRGIDVEGRNAGGQPFHWAMNRDSLTQTSTGGDLSSLALCMFDSRFARPDQCAQFSSLEENVALEGDEHVRYDVITGKTDSDSPTGTFYDCKFYFNRATGMLEHIIWCNPPVKAQYGKYANIRISYARVDGIYIPTESVTDAPDNHTRIVQRYSHVKLRQKVVADQPDTGG